MDKMPCFVVITWERKDKKLNKYHSSIFKFLFVLTYVFLERIYFVIIFQYFIFVKRNKYDSVFSDGDNLQYTPKKKGEKVSCQSLIQTFLLEIEYFAIIYLKKTLS